MSADFRKVKLFLLRNTVQYKIKVYNADGDIAHYDGTSVLLVQRRGVARLYGTKKILFLGK